MQAHSQGAVATKNLQNIEHKNAAQPAKERATTCRIRMLSWLETTETTQFYFDLSDQASET